MYGSLHYTTTSSHGCTQDVFHLLDKALLVSNVTDQHLSTPVHLPLSHSSLPDAYYMSFDAMCRHRFWRVSVFCYAVEYAGLTPTLQPKKGLDATVYVPNNDAFSKAIAKGIPSREDLVETLKYHVVPGRGCGHQ